MERGPAYPNERIAAELREKITEGAWLPGEQLPSVAALCETYQVSRVTVMKALGILREEGLITTVPRWGSFVAER